MEFRPLELRIIKANDLKDVNLITKMDVYAVVSISGDYLNNRKEKTTVDKDGGINPSWNFPMEFTVDDAAVQDNRLTLKIKLLSNRSLGDREIGVVYVQIKELFENCIDREGGGDDGGDGEKAGEKKEKFGTYSVRLPNGKAKGTLDLAYKFGEKYHVEQPPPPHMAEPYGMKGVEALPPHIAEPHGTKGVEAQPVMAYPSAFPASSSSYPPPSDAYPPPPGGYPYPPPSGAYPPPPQGYGYPPPPQSYGYPPPGYGYGGGYQPPPPGYGYPPMQQPQNPKKSGRSGMGMGVGAGLLGGLLIGDMLLD